MHIKQLVKKKKKKKQKQIRNKTKQNKAKSNNASVPETLFLNYLNITAFESLITLCDTDISLLYSQKFLYI